MTRIKMTAEAGTVGDPVTSSDVPGISVTGTGAGTSVYSTAQKMHGSKAIRIVSAAGTSRYLWFNPLTTTTAGCGFRGYIYLDLDAYPTSSFHMVQIRNSAGQAGIFALLANGRAQFQNAQSVSIDSAPADVLFPLKTWVRVEMSVVPGTTNANGRIRGIWAVGDGAATYSYDSGATIDAGTTPITNVRAGRANTTGDLVMFIDDFEVDDASAALMGPATSSTPPLANGGADRTAETGSGTVTLTGIGTATTSGATVVSHLWEYVSGPAVTPTPANSASTSFTAPTSSGTTVLRYTVTDSLGQTSAPDLVNITFVQPGQSFRPNSTSLNAGWTGTPSGTALHLLVDEITTDDGDYISSPDNPVQGANSVIFTFPTGTNPSGTAGRLGQVRCRVRPGTTSSSFIVTIKQGSTVVATRTWTDLTTAFTTRDITLTSGEAAAWNVSQVATMTLDPAAS